MLFKQSFIRLVWASCWVLLLLTACGSQSDSCQVFSYPFSEPTMIVNREASNLIEGSYWRVGSIHDDTLFMDGDGGRILDIVSDEDEWLVGYGLRRPLWDAGNENLCEIKAISESFVVLKEQVKGVDRVEVGQPICFWKKDPSGFRSIHSWKGLSLEQWPEFASNSVGFGALRKDGKRYYLFFNEVDTNKVQVYLASSLDLRTWVPENDGAPVFNAKMFSHTSWAGKDSLGAGRHAALISDVVLRNGVYHFFMEGYNSQGVKSVGLATSEHLLGPYEIHSEPIIHPGQDWDVKGCYYAKVIETDGGYVAFYDGIDRRGVERIGMARSSNLVDWIPYSGNPVISIHEGWNSSLKTSEPVRLDRRGDSLFLLLLGAKQPNVGLWHHYIERDMYLDKAGNVDDAQWGVFMSVDGGESFVQHCNNPVMINDYSNHMENEHLGRDMRLFEVDSGIMMFYQAKTNHPSGRYNLRVRLCENCGVND